MDWYFLHIQALREATKELLFTWSLERPLLPDDKIKNEADIAHAAAYRSIMQDLSHCALSPDHSALMAQCAKLIEHHRGIAARALWTRAVGDIRHTTYGRTLSIVEQHMRALAQIIQKPQI